MLSILKRLSRFHRVELPAGENGHLDLFKRFCPPAQPPLPALFDEPLARQLGPFRRFRHVVHHGYGFQIEWDRMREGLDQVAAILAVFRDRVADHVKTL
jgi:hypothetical protein